MFTPLTRFSYLQLLASALVVRLKGNSDSHLLRLLCIVLVLCEAGGEIESWRVSYIQVVDFLSSLQKVLRVTYHIADCILYVSNS